MFYPSNDRTTQCDTRYGSRSTSRNNYHNKNNSQNRYRSTSRDRFSYDKITAPPQYRPCTTSNVIPETPLEEYNLNTVPHYTRQNTVEFNQEVFMDPFQTQEPQQLNITPDQQQQDTTILQNVPDPSETALIQNVSELSQETVHITQTFTLTNDSNLIQVPIHNITQNTTNDQDQNDKIQTKTIHLFYLHPIPI